MELYTFDIVIENQDLSDIEIKYYQHMPQKYCIEIGEATLWFINYEDLKTFCLSIQSEFENMLIRKETVGAK